MTSYIDDINKIWSHGNVVSVSKNEEYVDIQSAVS